MIDSDPIISLSILLLEVLIMSILCWFLVLPIFFLLSKFIKGRNWLEKWVQKNTVKIDFDSVLKFQEVIQIG